MKVKLTIHLDMPDGNYLEPGYERESLNQLLFDCYVNELTRSHLKWSIKLLGELEKSTDKDTTLLSIAHHKLWVDICSKAKWDAEIEE